MAALKESEHTVKSYKRKNDGIKRDGTYREKPQTKK
jgi:hypothetical protein